MFLCCVELTSQVFIFFKNVHNLSSYLLDYHEYNIGLSVSQPLTRMVALPVAILLYVIKYVKWICVYVYLREISRYGWSNLCTLIA